MRTKITFPFLVIAIALALGAAYVITNLVFDTIDQRFQNQLLESGVLATTAMVQEEQRLLEVTRLLANTEGVAEALSSGQAETLRTLTFGMTVNQQVEAVEFLNAQGDLLLSMRHVPEGKEEE